MDNEIIGLIIFAVFYAVVYIVKNVMGEISSAGKKGVDTPRKADYGRPPQDSYDGDFEAARRMVEEMKSRANPSKSGSGELPQSYAGDFGREPESGEYKLEPLADRDFDADETDDLSEIENADIKNPKSYRGNNEGDISRGIEMLAQLEAMLAQEQFPKESGKGNVDDSAYNAASGKIGKTCAIFEDVDSLKRAVIASELLSPPLSLRRSRL